MATNTVHTEISISLPRWKPQFNLPPLFSSFSVSLFVHVVLLTGGVWWAGESLRSLSGPSEFELVGLDAAFQSGVNQREKKASVAERRANANVEQAVLAKPQEKKTQESGESAKASQGSGGTAAANVGTANDVWAQYGASVRQAILDRFRYPSASRSLGETGRVKIAFAVMPDGAVVDVRVKAPSAFERLNDAAVAMVADIRRVSPLPMGNIPRWDTEIAIDFLLN